MLIFAREKYLYSCRRPSRHVLPYIFRFLCKIPTIVDKHGQKTRFSSPNIFFRYIFYSTPAASSSQLLARVMADLTHAHKKLRTRCTRQLPFCKQRCQVRDFIPRSRDFLKQMGFFWDFFFRKSISGFFWDF